MAEKKKYNSILVSGRKDETLTYSRYVKDEESGESVKESLDKKVNITDELTTQQIKNGAITNEKMAADSVGNTNLQNGSVSNEKIEDGSITNEKLAENSITKDKLKDNTIGVEKLDPELRQTINAATGLPDDLVETIQIVDDTLKEHQRQLDNKQSQIDDKQQQITANDEDISLLQTRSTQMEETIKGIAATGGASLATAVTYDNTTSQLTSVNIQGAVDELQDSKIDKTSILQESGDAEDKVMSQKAVSDKLSDLQDKKFDKENIAQEFGDSEDKVVSQFALPFREIESPEFIKAIVDAEDHFLFGIQLDGSIEWGKGIPAPIRTKLHEIINQYKQDNMDILEVINEAKRELYASITALQESKVDKEEGKSLIEDEVKECFRIIENEEFIKAIVDSEDRFLFGIYRDSGKPYFPLNEMYHVEQNEEFFAVWLDAVNHVLFGIRRDGQIIGEIHAVNALKQVISQLQSDVATLQEKVGTIDSNLKELLDVFSLQDNEEYLTVEQDAEGKVLSATNPDGSKIFHTPLIPKSSIKFDDRTIYEDEVEDYKELLLDSDNKILRYTDKNGVIHENREIVFSSTNLGSNESEKELTVPRSMNLPKYGYTDIKEETFYLTANEGYSDKNGILAMLVNEDTQANAQKGLTPYKYFVKSTLQNTDGVYSVTSESVSLNFYVPSDVKEVGGKSYVTSSLTNGSDGSYTVNPTSIEVTKIVDKPNVGTWEISKKTKHWCVVDIDFGSYLKGTYNVLVSFQGSSTLLNRQKNFRYAFVKSDYKSKVKLKIGELLKVDKFNLKSYYSDDTKLKEPIIFRLYLQAKELRNFNEQYPWSSSSIIATGATGIIKSFPVCTSVGGEFYGVQFFGYKKDKNNYMLSGDEDGMIISGGVGCNWAKFDWSTWEDEMNDDPTETNRVAVEKFYQFINGSDFTKENAPKHMNINDWIDYFIFIQVFRLRDNDIHNLILYSGKDKTVFSPFLYDLDLAFNVYNYNLEVDKTNTIWLKLKELFWDEICERYSALRNTVLNVGNFNLIISDLQSNIDYSDFKKGVNKWGVRDAQLTTGKLADTFSELLDTFDLYFKN